MLDSSIASPVSAAHLTKLWNKLHRPPDTCKRDYQTFPSAIAPKITHELIHLHARVCHVSRIGHNLERLDVGKEGDATTILFRSKDYPQLRNFASFGRTYQLKCRKRDCPKNLTSYSKIAMVIRVVVS